MKKRILFLLDASGSMDHIKNDAIGGFNAWKRAMELVENDIRITLATFDEKPPRIIYDDIPVRKVPDLTLNEYIIGGSTALYDAIGSVIDHTEKRMGKNDTALIVILTDGEENVSRHYNSAQIRKLIQDREARGWAFSYISAGLDAFANSAAVGIGKNDTVQFQTNTKGMEKAYSAVTHASMSYVSGEREDQATWSTILESKTTP